MDSQIFCREGSGELHTYTLCPPHIVQSIPIILSHDTLPVIVLVMTELSHLALQLHLSRSMCTSQQECLLFGNLITVTQLVHTVRQTLPSLPGLLYLYAYIAVFSHTMHSVPHYCLLTFVWSFIPHIWKPCISCVTEEYSFHSCLPTPRISPRI